MWSVFTAESTNITIFPASLLVVDTRHDDTRCRAELYTRLNTVGTVVTKGGTVAWLRHRRQTVHLQNSEAACSTPCPDTKPVHSNTLLLLVLTFSQLLVSSNEQTDP